MHLRGAKRRRHVGADGCRGRLRVHHVHRGSDCSGLHHELTALHKDENGAQSRFVTYVYNSLKEAPIAAPTPIMLFGQSMDFFIFSTIYKLQAEAQSSSFVWEVP